MREITLTKGYVALVDDDDYDAVACHRWHALETAGLVYAARKTGGRANNRSVLMHRELTGAPKGMDVDHIDGNGLHNGRLNLRVCTHAQNLHNIRHAGSGSSRFLGASWSERDHCWYSRIRIDKRVVHLGVFKTEEDAALAYDRAVAATRGEFATFNFPHRRAEYTGTLVLPTAPRRLTPDEVVALRAEYRAGVSQSELARRHGVSRSTARSAALGESHRKVEEAA